jgi:hypothetical protein
LPARVEAIKRSSLVLERFRIRLTRNQCKNAILFTYELTQGVTTGYRKTDCGGYLLAIAGA